MVTSGWRADDPVANLGVHRVCVSDPAYAVVLPVRPHDLRHTCVSMLLSLGANPRVVTEIVGHAALEMTMNVYAHVVVDEQRSASDKLDGLYDR